MPPFVVQTLRAKREELAAERAAAVAELDRKIAEIDFVLHEGATPIDVKPAVEAAAQHVAQAFNAASIVATAEALIAAKVPATPKAIGEALARAGVEVPPDANVKIIKALWRTGRYVGRRDEGWVHKVE